LRWTGSIALDVELPPLIGETLVRLQLQEQFEGMVREIERREQVRRGPRRRHRAHDQRHGRPRHGPATTR
jgi:hypothetical protein